MIPYAIFAYGLYQLIFKERLDNFILCLLIALIFGFAGL